MLLALTPYAVHFGAVDNVAINKLSIIGGGLRSTNLIELLTIMPDAGLHISLIIRSSLSK